MNRHKKEEKEGEAGEESRSESRSKITVLETKVRTFILVYWEASELFEAFKGLFGSTHDNLPILKSAT